MLDAPDEFLVPLDDPTETEGKSAWEQIVDVAIKKAPVYMEGAANILVVESDSECLDLMVNSAVHEYDRRAIECGPGQYPHGMNQCGETRRASPTARFAFMSSS